MTVSGVVHPGWRLDVPSPSEATLALTGDWIARKTALRDPAEVWKTLSKSGSPLRLRFDTGALGRWDSTLIVFLQALRRSAAEAGPRRVELDEAGLPEAARRLLTLAGDASPPPSAERPQSDSLLARVGQGAFRGHAEGVAVLTLIGETVLRGAAALIGRVWTRASDVMTLMREAGASALGIVAVCNVLVGGILAFVGAVQLRRFGAEIYVADLVGIAMAREMAAMMTAIVMAGRTGGAYAAQLATMQGNEEIDALQAFGIPVFDYLVLPRILALTLMMPLLYVYACAVGLLGGLIVALATLDVSALAYVEETRNAIAGRHFALGLCKSVAFGALVALAGCHIGLTAGRSAAEVGRAATSAVVVGIIGIIAIDAVFAVCADALRL
jgi:phospholipid/cholesterol/gamma-HCH transport system permease protein